MRGGRWFPSHAPGEAVDVARWKILGHLTPCAVRKGQFWR